MSDARVRVVVPDIDGMDRAGREKARLIWNDETGTAAKDDDPRHPAFARAVIDEFAAALSGTAAVIRKVMNRASSAAEDLNVEPFQGLIEVIQNADDLQAKEVRFALREAGDHQQLLIVHDGLPVSYGHVLAMTLPFLTTKEDDSNQKGRFGIGLKTLARISSGLSVHSAPYHFSARRLSISNIKAESTLDGFYDAAKDTLLVLDLNSGFDNDALSEWFDQWSDDGLIFLSTVHRFRWCSVQGKTLIERTIRPQAWKSAGFPLDFPEQFEAVRSREIAGADANWTIFSAYVNVPEALSRAHKATGKSTPISIAISSNDEPGSLYIAFKTRIPSSLVISIDAQFDPSTAREDLIDNAWNRWLIERCGDVLLFIANELLIQNPLLAWKVIPLGGETLGSIAGRWPRAQFNQAFERVKETIGSEGRISMAGQEVMLNETAYEDPRFIELLTTGDMEKLAPGRKAILAEVRDVSNRWREVLDEIGVSEKIDTGHLLKGFDDSLFEEKSIKWWIEAGSAITRYHPVSDVFNVPFLRSFDGRAVACQQKDTTSRPLVFGDRVSRFCTRWALLDRLHDAYGGAGAGESLRDWLVKHAAYTIEPNAEAELAAFAEKFVAEPVEIFEIELRELRDRFGWVSERRAADLGRRVGAAIHLNGSTYQKGGRRSRCKVSPGEAYLPKTLDSEHADWPEAAGNLPGIAWLSAAYDEQLKIAGGRNQRRRDDGYTARGARRFLMLLGAETAPRLIKAERKYGGRPSRVKQLAKVSAHVVEYDFESPDLELMLAAIPRMGKRERKLRSAALMRAISHNWDRVYHRQRNVPAQQVARKHNYPRGDVAADWLCLLWDTPWVVISNGELRKPAESVIRNSQTETLYETASFVAGLEGVELSSEFVATLRLITDVRVRDLVTKLESLRAAERNTKDDVAVILQIYRTLSKLCPPQTSWSADVGDMSQFEFRRRFGEGAGLICLLPGEWKRPNELFGGRDVFRKPELFVPSAPAYADLWRILEIRSPELGDCTRFCRQLAQQAYSTSLDAVLMDVYRYIESLLAKTERVKNRLVNLPLACSGQWVVQRPVYLVEDRELRAQLAKALPATAFWSPPCDVRDMPHLADALGIEQAAPELRLVVDSKEAQDEGENHRPRFHAAVEHLSTELARHEFEIREKLQIAWDDLPNIPLFVYPAPFPVEASCPAIHAEPLRVAMKALLTRKPLALHVWIEGFQLRDSGGRAIASLFATDVQRRIEAEWVASWAGSKEEPVEVMRLASDEEKRESQLAAALELAGQIEPSQSGKIAVSPPASRTSSAKPRRLKPVQGGISGATVHVGTPPTLVVTTQTIPLASSAPAPSAWPSSSSSSPAPVEYSTADLEQRGWEVLLEALKTHDGPELQDFRRRRGVGADGAMDWKKFIELKASGRSMPASIEMTNTEFERAKESGKDYILALVYGLEEGQHTEARLIFDPASSLILKPVAGMRLTGLSEATAVILHFR